MRFHKRTLLRVIRETFEDVNCKSTTLYRSSYIVCLLCFLVIYFYSQVDPFKHTTNPDIDIDLSHIMRAKDVDLRIIVLTFNRYASLLRLLDSLNKAYYFNDKVVLEIWLDRSKKGNIDTPTLTEATNFKFSKGLKCIYMHTRHVGIYGQWMATWQPNDQTEEIAVIFEDDTSVSPWFYRYLKKVHQWYSKHDFINGFALQVNVKHGKQSGQLNVSSNSVVFLYPVIGTSGFSPKRDNWSRFLEWYKMKYKTSFVPLVPDIQKPTQWFIDFIFQNRTDTMWEMWHIYFAYINREWTLYPNFGYNLALTKNWKAKGLHFDDTKKDEDRVQLVVDWNYKLNSLPKHPIKINTNGVPEVRKTSS